MLGFSAKSGREIRQQQVVHNAFIVFAILFPTRVYFLPSIGSSQVSKASFSLYPSDAQVMAAARSTH